MKKIILICLIGLFTVSQSKAQEDKDVSIMRFANMIGGVWKAEGKWMNGNDFKQHMEFEWGLNQTIIKVKTYGVIEEEGGEFGLRSEGIRAWNERDNSFKFWEFDVFGGVTEGLCIIDGESVHYLYEYKWDESYALFKDSWTQIDDDTYRYRVGIFAAGQWKSIYLDTTFKRYEK